MFSAQRQELLFYLVLEFFTKQIIEMHEDGEDIDGIYEELMGTRVYPQVRGFINTIITDYVARKESK